MSHASVLVALDSDPQSPEALRAAVSEQMQPFDENGSWFADGSRWDWWQIGGRFTGMLGGHTLMRRGDLDLAALAEYQRRELTANYEEAKKENSSQIIELIYGVKPGETLDEYLARTSGGFPAPFAFLHNHAWYERGRMGWFGGSTSTECERSDEAPKGRGKCIHRARDAQIVSYGDESIENWRKHFFGRFLRKLAPETLLVVVDYHV